MGDQTKDKVPSGQGTQEPWKRPGQSSQDPSQEPPKKKDEPRDENETK